MAQASPDRGAKGPIVTGCRPFVFIPSSKVILRRLMRQRDPRLCRGDLVEVKAPDEIVQTLDAEGASDHLPFMPEMLEFCGRRFRVSRRVLTICFSGPGSTRGFRTDVVTLD